MIGRDPTGSRFHRLLKCVASAALPQVDDLEPSPPAARGTAIHRFLQRVSEMRGAGMSADDARGAALREMAGLDEETFGYLEILDVESLPTDLAAEVALAYDWAKDTARELGRGIERDYSGLGSTEIAMTIDVLGLQATAEFGGDVVFVADYKMGRLAVPAPAENGQVMLGALAAARLYGADAAELEIIRADEDGRPFRHEAFIDGDAIDAFADRVRATMESLSVARAIVGRGGTPNVTTGEHCRYCPAFRACPAQTAMVRAAMAGPPGQTGGILGPGALAPDRLARTWRTLKELRVALGALEGEILVLAGREPIDLGGGTFLGPVEVVREIVTDANAAHAVLEARYSREAADAAMTRKSSKAAIRKVISKYKPTKSKLSTKDGDGEMDRVIDALRASGGLRESRSVRVRETTADKLAAPLALPAGHEVTEEPEDSEEFG